MSRNDGKYLEDAVEEELKKITLSNFYWRRLHDTRAARSYIPAQPADYFLCQNGTATHLECKSQKGKTNRLKKFSQLPEMKRWDMAGVLGMVLVHFWDLDTIQLVDVRELDADKPSWILTGPVYETIGEALHEIINY